MRRRADGDDAGVTPTLTYRFGSFGDDEEEVVLRGVVRGCGSFCVVDIPKDWASVRRTDPNPIALLYSTKLIYEYTKYMEMFSASIFFGWFLGFGFGVGCALAVMYSIYRSGYRNAVLDALRGTHPERYRDATIWAKKKIEGKISDSIH